MAASGDLLQRLLAIVRSPRAVAVPKYTSRNELLQRLRVEDLRLDGRTVATFTLEPGEFLVVERAYGDDPQAYHLPACLGGDDREVDRALRDVGVVYYRPFGWLPALRLEVPGNVLRSTSRLAVVLEGITRQLFTPAVLEPYPLFLADRMVKSLGAGLAAVEQAVTQHMVSAGADVQTVVLCMQNYRTEGGRGGV